MRYKWTFWVSLITAIVAALLVAPRLTQAQNPVWVGDYFNNPTLSGDPVLTRNDANISFNWGANAPADGIPADNFSVRWGTDVFLTAGTYRFSATADDKIRVIFNFQATPLVDTFNQDTVGQLITADVDVPTDGTYHIQVDYQEITGNAFAEVSFVGVSGQVVSPVGESVLPPTGATVTVTAGRLNVRNEPSTQTGEILTVVNLNETYPVLARNADTSWYLLNVNSIQGWVSAQWVDINPADATIPVVGAVDTTATSTPAAGGLVVTATPFNVNIRSEPNVDSERLDLLPAGESAEVIGRVADNSWWQINFNGITGWVSAEFAIIAEGADINSIPVTG